MYACVHVHLRTCSSTLKCGEIQMRYFWKTSPSMQQTAEVSVTPHRASERVDTGTRKKGGERESNGKNVDRGKNEIGSRAMGG